MFFPVRTCYQRLLDKEKWLFWKRMREFYSQFVNPGDVVFDVGANVGVYSEVFLQIGGKVVAIEPNSECCRQIRTQRPQGIVVENCAAGSAPGTVEFHLCEESSMSTISSEWIEAVSKSELHKGVKWLSTIRVPVKTLDMLAQSYGQPGFIKIDAEGYDDRVLSGMSFRPAALSFEFNVNSMDVALNCLKAPVLLDGYLFNYTVGQLFSFRSQKWINREEMVALLEQYNLQEEYGDVFARRSQ